MPKKRTRKTEKKLHIPDMGVPKSEEWEGWQKRICMAVPTTGLVRVEWMMARFGQVIPCNWSQGDIFQFMDQYSPMGWAVADARNVCIQYFIDQQFEWCFKGLTEIETSDGVKFIKDVEEGDLVRTHKGELRKVIKKMIRPYLQGKPLIEVETEMGDVKCTPEHPFLAIRDGVVDWLKARDLKPDDELLHPLDREIETDDLEIEGFGTLTIDQELAWFMGYYLANGNAEYDSIRFTVGNHNPGIRDTLVEICMEKFDRKPTVYKRWATSIKLNIVKVGAAFKEMYGPNAREKKVPEIVTEWCLRNRLAFIKGYLEGDGSIQSGVTFSSASKQLVDGFIDLSRGAGLSAKNYGLTEPSESVIQGRLVKNTGCHLGHISKRSWQKMLDLLNAKQNQGHLAIRVVGVTNKKMAGNLNDYNVYNLEVEEDNSYIANGFSVHNCFFIDHDVILPPDTFLKINEYMNKGDIPIVSGLYYCKGTHPEPLLFRGRGNSVYQDWEQGDKVWVDGIPLGCCLIHGSILKLMYDESEVYTLQTIAGPVVVRRVFETPRKAWYDPEQGRYNTKVGTEDLWWNDRIIKENVFKRAGWPKFQKKKYPFLLDTGIFCRHINEHGQMFP